MADLNRAAGMFAAHLLRGRGARRSSGGNDQRSRGQDTGDDGGIPMAPIGFMPPSLPTPPPYSEVVLDVNAEVPFTEEDVARAARHLGHIRQLQRERHPEIEGRWIEDIDEQASRRFSGWDRLYRRYYMQWKQRCVYLCLLVFGIILLLGVFVFVAVMHFLYHGSSGLKY